METVFDKQAIRLKRLRALRLGKKDAAFLLQRVADEVFARLLLVERQFARPCVSSANAAMIDRSFLEPSRLVNMPGMQPEAWAEADEELPWHSGQGHDLALSFLTLHETNDTPGALIHIRRSLKPDGLFMGVMAGSGTLMELRESWLAAEAELAGGARAHVHPFADVRSAGSLLQRAGFALPVVDEEKVTVRYANMFALMHDLRAMGATNALTARNRTATRRDVMMRAARIYQDRFGESDGRIPATFSFIYLSGWAPDESQQKPARRGSATVSLAEALKQA